MLEYQMRPLKDGAGERTAFLATSDEAAVSFAQGQAHPDGSELWQGERLVATVRPEDRVARRS